MKKTFLTLILAGLFKVSTTQAEVLSFVDLDENSPNFTAIIALANSGIISGINGEIRLQDSISKIHSVNFLLKLINRLPDPQLAIDSGIISQAPTETENLTLGEWIVMLSRAFEVKLTENSSLPWYQSALDNAVTIGALTANPDPTTVVTREIAISTGYAFRQYYHINSQNSVIVQAEQNLMTIRDSLVNPTVTAENIEQQIWNSLVSIDSINGFNQNSDRVQAIRNYHYALLMIHEKRKSSNQTANNFREQIINHYVNLATAKLPASQSFANDVLQLAGISQ